MLSMTESNGNGVRDFIICLKPDLTPIGKCGVWQDTEIGIIISREHWGKGLALEALQAVLPRLFDQLSFEELVADIDPRNKASEALLKKVGFEDDRYEEKTMQVGDEWVDSQYLKLTREVWRKVSPRLKTAH
jgi:[ribosomal protein S5]-alanine N-acetyltransferase